MKFDFGEIARDVNSPQQPVRGKAMQNLLRWAEKDKGVHQKALPIFRAAIERAQDSFTTLSAVRGIAVIAPQEARHTWLALLDSPNADIATSAALLLADVSFLPDLVALLDRRTELKLVSGVIRTLGRMRDIRAFEVIATHLNHVATRPEAIQALGDLGDERAIPLLASLAGDTTELWREDDHGPMLRVCDLAAVATRCIQAATLR